MGAVVSSTNGGDHGGMVAELTHPSKPDWLGLHAGACNVSEEEISDLWKQFQEIGCNQDGVISGKVLIEASNSNTMTSRILEMMPRSKDNVLSFQTFCNMSRWLADASIEKKIRAVFQCLNKGQPLDLKVLMEILSEIYCDESQEVIERSSKVFLHQAGDILSHSIDEEQFVEWALQLPKDTIQAIMDFKCTTNERQSSDDTKLAPSGTGLPSTKDLMKISRMASRQDWMILANQLGFTQNDVSLIKKELPGEELDQIQRMLSQWMQKHDEQATLSALKEALRNSNMADIAESLDSNA